MSRIVLGIDPGLLRTGWAVVEYVTASEMRYVDSGIVKMNPSGEFFFKLETIHKAITDVIEQLNPTVAVLEKIFVNSNPHSSLNLAYCRGALMLTLTLKGLHIIEIAPNSMKKRITGNGHATKVQVKYMVEQLLGLKSNLSKYSDLYDALALASSVTMHEVINV